MLKRLYELTTNLLQLMSNVSANVLQKLRKEKDETS